MSAVRFGRMPKTEREKLMADKEEMTNNRSDYVIELRTLSDVIKKAFRQNISPIIENFKSQQEKVNFKMVFILDNFVIYKYALIKKCC